MKHQKQNLAMFFSFPNRLHLLAACCSYFKEGLTALVVAEKKLHSFEMVTSWAMLPAQTLTLSGSPAMEDLNRVCKQSATCYNPTLDLGQREWLSEAMNGHPLTSWTGQSQQARQP